MASAAYAGAGRLSAQAAKSATTTASRTASSGASTCISPSGLSGGVLTGTAPSFCTFGLGSEARRSADRKPPGPIGGGRSVLPFSPQRRLSHCPAAAGNANIAEKPGRKHMTIRRLLLFGALMFAGSWPLAGAKAEDNYPSKPVRIISRALSSGLRQETPSAIRVETACSTTPPLASDKAVAGACFDVTPMTRVLRSSASLTAIMPQTPDPIPIGT